MRKTLKESGLVDSTPGLGTCGCLSARPRQHRETQVENSPDGIRFSTRLDERDSLSLPILRLIGAFSASEGIRKDTGLVSWVRWPNEVVLDGRVVARVRTRRSSSDRGGTSLLFLVNTRNRPTRGGLRAETSLYAALGVEIDESLLIEKILDSLEWMQLGWRRGLIEQITARISETLEDSGSIVRVIRGGNSLVGRVIGVDSSARLLVSGADLPGILGVPTIEMRSVSRVS